MKTITINDIPFNIPTSYNEVDEKQFDLICQLLANNTPGNQLKTLYYLLRLQLWNWHRRKQNQVIKLLNAEWVHTLLTDKTLLGWIFEDPKLHKYFIQSFWCRGLYYVGPAKRILNISASEFVFAYTFYKQYSQTKDSKALDSLMAVLYRPLNPLYLLNAFTYGYAGDQRISLNTFLFEKRIKRFATLPHALKLGIFMQFSSAWAQFETKKEFEYVFRKVGDSTAKEDPFVWEKIMMKMAEQGTFGTYNDVQKMDKDRFFLCMQKNIEEYVAQKDATGK
jgi:hypothetical protein